MPNQSRFNKNDKVCVIQSASVIPEIRGACGIILEVNQGDAWGTPPRETRRWNYEVDFGPPLGERSVPQGLLEHALQ